MTYCLGIKVNEGLVCLADGRVTSGNQVTTAQKVSRPSAEARPSPRRCKATMTKTDPLPVQEGVAGQRRLVGREVEEYALSLCASRHESWAVRAATPRLRGSRLLDHAVVVAQVVDSHQHHSPLAVVDRQRRRLQAIVYSLHPGTLAIAVAGRGRAHRRRDVGNRRAGSELRRSKS